MSREPDAWLNPGLWDGDLSPRQTPNRLSHRGTCNLHFFKRFYLFIYLTEIEIGSERLNTSRGNGRGRSRLPVEEPDVGLDPITLGSRPEPKADT